MVKATRLIHSIFLARTCQSLQRVVRWPSFLARSKSSHFIFNASQFARLLFTLSILISSNAKHLTAFEESIPPESCYAAIISLINSFLSQKEHNNVSGYIFFYPENLRHIRAPVMGCRFAVGQSFITSMKSDIDWRSRPRQGCPCAVVVAMLLHTPGACQELTRGAKDGKLGVMTTQLPDHSNLSRTIQLIATSDSNNKTAGCCPISSFGSIHPTPRSRRRSRLCV